MPMLFNSYEFLFTFLPIVLVGCKSAVGLGADQRRNTLDVHISSGSTTFAD